MRAFELIGTEGSLVLEGEPPAVSAPYFGWDYTAKLTGRSIQAQLKVGDDNPPEFVDFFESIARDWRGWTGERTYESLDGNMMINATHDSLKAVSFLITFRSYGRTGFDSSATQKVGVELGALERLAELSRSFAT